MFKRASLVAFKVSTAYNSELNFVFREYMNLINFRKKKYTISYTSSFVFPKKIKGRFHTYFYNILKLILKIFLEYKTEQRSGQC